MSETALAIQVGGDHYKTMKIQPVEFAEVNGLTTCQFNILKYVCRHRSKEGRADLEKAAHYCDLWIELADTYGRWSAPPPSAQYVIPVDTFLEVNKIPPTEAQIVELICVYPNKADIESAKFWIQDILSDYPA